MGTQLYGTTWQLGYNYYEDMEIGEIYIIYIIFIYMSKEKESNIYTAINEW